MHFSTVSKMTERVLFGYKRLGVCYPWFWFIYIYIPTETDHQREPEHPAVGWSHYATRAPRNALPAWSRGLWSVLLGMVCLCSLLAQTLGRFKQWALLWSFSLAIRMCYLPRSEGEAQTWATVARFVFAAVSLTYSVSLGKSCHTWQLLFQHGTEAEILWI